MTTPRLAVFDVDGTLVDSQGHILAAMAAAFAAVGAAMPAREAVLGIVGLSLPVAVATLAPGIPAEDRLRLVEAYKDHFADLRRRGATPVFPGAAELLARLAARDDLLLGIATGKSRRGLMHLLDETGWRGHFVTLQVADDHPSKPDPSMLRAALAETGIAPAAAVMIGDTDYDIAMGRAAGVGTIGVTWGYHPAARLQAAVPGQVVTDFAALGAALDGFGRG